MRRILIYEQNNLLPTVLLFFYFPKVLRFPAKKTPAERSYVAALCRILASLHFHLSEQGPVKIMRRLLSRVCESVLSEKDILKELKLMAERLEGLDRNPDQDLSEDEVKYIFGKYLTLTGKITIFFLMLCFSCQIEIFIVNII